MVKKNCITIFASFTIALVSCQQQEIRPDQKELFTREFITQFGVPDGNHDWNMAGRITANIVADGIAPGHEIRIYDRMPGAEGCQIAARFSAQTKTVKFDFAKSNKYAYIEVISPNGDVVSVKSLEIKNNMININVLGKKVSRSSGNVTEKIFDMRGNFQNRLPGSYDNKYNEYFKTNYPKLTPRTAYDFYLICENLPENDDLHSCVKKPAFDDNDEGMACSDLKSIVGSHGVFKEGAGKVDCNLMEYWEELQPTTNSVFTMAETGPVSIDYLYGCGTYRNTFGYFYYDDTYTDIEIMRTPKFILMLDASPWHNMLRYDPAQNDNGFSNFELIGRSKTDNKTWTIPNQINQSGMRPSNDISEFEKEEKKGDASLYNVRYKGSNHVLIYYPQKKGLDSNGYPCVTADLNNPSYDFPQGTKIGFFIISEGGFYFSKYGRAMGNSAVRYSIPWMNQWLGRPFHNTDKTPTHTGCSKIPADTPPTWFMSYKWNGRTILGVEDGDWGKSDHDMNDIIFAVNGSFAIDRHDLGNRTKVQSWVIACEDLGSTGDFDFNDVVFGVSHLTSDSDDNTDHRSELIIKPLAAGGTLKVQLCFNFGTAQKPDIQVLGNPNWHWNQYFNESSSHRSLFNVTGDAGRAIDSKEIVIENVPADFSLTSGDFRENMGGFSLRVFKENGETITDVKAPGTQGDDALAPQMILLPVNWDWPRENIAIHDAYPGTHNGDDENPIIGFGSWVRDASQYSWTFYPAHGDKVYSNNWEAPNYDISVLLSR